MTDHQQAAIEAANRELRNYSAVCYFPDSPEYVNSLDKLDEGDAAEYAIQAAEPHLRKKWAEEVAEKVNALSGFHPQVYGERGSGFNDCRSLVLDLLEGAGL